VSRCADDDRPFLVSEPDHGRLVLANCAFSGRGRSHSSCDLSANRCIVPASTAYHAGPPLRVPRAATPAQQEMLRRALASLDSELKALG